MWAPSTSASVIRMTLPYRAALMSKLRPEPAPTTWMRAAHSALESMSPTEAFWTLRILPRMGSSAWKSEERASLAVPSAESPSTMNSSERATSSVRQSASLVGMRGRLEGVLAALGFLVDAGGDARLHLADDLFQQQRRLGFVVAVGRGQLGVDLLLHHLGHDGAHGGGAQDFLGLALELRLGEPDGQDGGEPGEDVVLFDLVVAGLELAGIGFDRFAEGLQERLLEAGLVGSALGRGDDVDEGAHGAVVADAPAEGDVDLAVPLDLRSGGCGPCRPGPARFP